MLLFRCKPEHEFNYTITTSDVVIEVDQEKEYVFDTANFEMRLADDGDADDERCYNAKVIYSYSHNDSVIGEGVFIEKIHLSERFEEITSLDDAIYDDTVITHGWEKVKEKTYEHADNYLNTVREVNIRSEQFNCKDLHYMVGARGALNAYRDNDSSVRPITFNECKTQLIDIDWVGAYNQDLGADEVKEYYLYNTAEKICTERDYITSVGFKPIKYDFDSVPFRNRAYVFEAYTNGKGVFVYLPTHDCAVTHKNALRAIINSREDLKSDERLRPIISAIMELDEEKFYEVIEPIAEEYFKQKEIRERQQMFKTFADNFKGAEKKRVEAAIARQEEQVDDARRELIALEGALKENVMRLFYIKHNKEGENEFIDFLDSLSDKVEYCSIDEEKLCFRIRTYMTFWDEDLYHIIRTSDYSFNDLPDGYKHLLDAIFKKRSLKLRIVQTFRLMLDRSYGAVDRWYDTEKKYPDSDWGIPNVHINRYNCFGSHKTPISEAVMSGDYVSAVAQAISACSGISWDDSAVVSAFLSSLQCSEYREMSILEKADGTTITIQEFLDSVSGKEWRV